MAESAAAVGLELLLADPGDGGGQQSCASVASKGWRRRAGRSPGWLAVQEEAWARWAASRTRSWPRMPSLATMRLRWVSTV